MRTSGFEVHETAVLARCLKNRPSHEPVFLPSPSGRESQQSSVKMCRIVETAKVRHVRRFGGSEALADRFRYGFEFGRLRTIGATPFMRWAGLVAGPAIFVSQVGRVSSTILRNRRCLGRFVGALPITLALLASWSVGEWLGWCLGPPGRSPARKRRGKKVRTPGSRAGRLGSPPAGCSSGPPVA